jgi:hypothetical protein
MFSYGFPCIQYRVKSGICRTYAGLEWAMVRLCYEDDILKTWSIYTLTGGERCFNYHYKIYYYAITN